MGINEPADDVVRAVADEFDTVRRFVQDFDPTLVVVFGPDHFNGFFYDMLPPFCVGTAASSVGDWGTGSQHLDVHADYAGAIAERILGSEIDVAVSARMRVDHGFAQPLELIFGAVDAIPTVPIFVNASAAPLGPTRRARLLGSAVGAAIADFDERVLVLGSGGLSHDPPVPALSDPDPEVVERLIAGRDPHPDVRAAREARQVLNAQAFTAGARGLRPLNPCWDRDFLDLLVRGELTKVDTWSNDWLTEQAGRAVHEVRTWVAAYSALAIQGPYRVTSRFYREIPEWIAGFAITTALPAT
jgi:2,3-dihydroxyphenylpropionate 1,2-dioxygenase